MPERAAEQLGVLVADGQPLFREAIVRAIRQSGALRVVGEVASGRAALRRILEVRPDVAVVDAEVPDLDGLGLIDALTRAGDAKPPTRVLLVATEVEPPRVYAALAAGADGYLSRWADSGELCAAIAAVAGGETVLSAEAQTAIASEILVRDRGERSLLTPRQLRMLDLVAEGLTAREIAARLGLSPSAVKADLARAYERLGVSERAAAVAAAMRRGLIR
ncbi:MAG: two component transcriptional regulator, LuxR family [Solirubrobacterales bacterium]|nr:two component transcriptional regulator, LuxR family [Solirubrobacterales bacterium]